MSIVGDTIDLSGCDQEPIHIPGSIQPHGMMLIVDQVSLIIRHVAGEIEQRLGVAAWEGQQLSALIGEMLGARIAARPVAGFVGQLQVDSGELFDVSAHRSGQYIVVELEPAALHRPPVSRVLESLSEAAAGFERSASFAALCSRAAIEFRRLTGFDRVMVYQFLDDGVGRVVEEDRRENMHSFLNHHFPASDIPRQARNLYVRNLVRVIPDVMYHPADLRPRWSAETPLDMSDCSLRSVSPIHLQYLSNMNTRASASFSVVKDGVLWGLIACHHETPRLLTYDVRAAGRSLAGALARQIGANENVKRHREQTRQLSLQDEMAKLLSEENSLDEALHKHLSALGRMIASDGVAVQRGTDLVVDGVCPSEHDIRGLAAWLSASTAPIFSTDRLSNLYPPAVRFQRTASGLLAVTLSAEAPGLLLWFRGEQHETIDWAGYPHKSESQAAHTPLTPRASFDSWREIVRGRSRGWTLSEVDAASRLQAVLADIQHNQRVQELNRQLKETLREKNLLLQQNEFLIREVNHQVESSLQLVSGYLGLQIRQSDDPELLLALKEASRRISAVALAHRRLYRGDQVGSVDVARYLEELCADTSLFMGRDWEQHFSLKVVPLIVSTDWAVTLGLLLVELLINANKFAYDGRPGPIEIELSADDELLHLTVADKGVGMVSSGDGFGLIIVQGLAGRLGGKFTYSDNQPGLRVEITMPISPSPRQAWIPASGVSGD